MAYKMKGSPMQRNFGIGTSPVRNEKKTTRSGESTGDTTSTKKVHWNTGAINTTGTKIVNEKGDWTNIDSVAGKQLKGRYAKTNYADSATTPSGDVVNVDKTKVTKQ